MRLVLFLLALTGCGRLSFDGLGDDGDVASDDARGDGMGDQSSVCVVANDEDGDGTLDCEDLCPHIALLQSDSDGDGIGDDCDPNVSTPGDVLVMFDPFLTLQPIWEGRDVSVANGQLVMPGDQGNLFSSIDQDMPRGRDSFEVGAVVDSGNGTFPQHVSVGHLGGNTEFYCEVLDQIGTSMGAVQLAWTPDGVNYTSAPASQFDGTSIIGGAGRLRMRLFVDVVVCSAEWRSIPRDTSSSDPLALVTDRLRISAQNVTARLDWFLHIRSP